MGGGRDGRRGDPVSILARPVGQALRSSTPSGSLLREGVSILARLEGRALPAREGSRRRATEVSILARLEGRALRARARYAPSGLRRFNPRPARRPGAPTSCTPLSTRWKPFQSSPGSKAGRSPLAATTTIRLSPSSFNPRPARRPGAPLDDGPPAVGAVLVSILARLEGRALRSLLQWQTNDYKWFQSSPGSKAGRSMQRPPPPRLRPAGFNPRPARRPGAPSHWNATVDAITAFQSSPGSKAGRSRHGRYRMARPAHWRFQSSPGSKAGRSPHRGIRAILLAAAPSGFNPRPARRPGAPIVIVVGLPRGKTFQSSPGSKAGRSGQSAARGPQ